MMVTTLVARYQPITQMGNAAMKVAIPSKIRKGNKHQNGQHSVEANTRRGQKLRIAGERPDLNRAPPTVGIRL